VDRWKVPVAAGVSPNGVAVEREQAEAVQRVLDRLPDDYRLVLVLRHQEERSFEEIGQLLHRSAGAARKLWSRAVERFHKEWGLPP
jgi:RNA polymerase sigma-70 factor (ECF subfamily)